jgi:hypothetical protein
LKGRFWEVSPLLIGGLDHLQPSPTAVPVEPHPIGLHDHSSQRNVENASIGGRFHKVDAGVLARHIQFDAPLGYFDPTQEFLTVVHPLGAELRGTKWAGADCIPFRAS